jgi:catechol 2,3-dioxygenase-like lactoylglutathione lyase family enzyme
MKGHKARTTRRRLPAFVALDIGALYTSFPWCDLNSRLGERTGVAFFNEVITLHHAHLMASDIDATIAFWRDGFGAQIAGDVDFAGARNVFLRVGAGRIHLYDQPPKNAGQATVHHLGVQTDELEAVVKRLRSLGVSVTDIRREPGAAYAMAQGPDRLLVEIFQPDLAAMPPGLREYFEIAG